MKKKSKKPTEHFWAWIANLQQEHWIPYVIIVRFSAVWFSLVLTYLGPWIGLITTNKDGNQYLSVAGWITTGVILLIILLGEISATWLKKKSDEKYFEDTQKNEYYERGYLFQNRLLKSNNKLCKQRTRILLSKVHSLESRKNRKNGIISQVVCNPQKQLETIVSELTNCLLPFFEETSGGETWTEDDIFISIAYQFPIESEDWHWATEERGLSLAELIAANSSTSCQSTFSYLLNSSLDSVFFNSKNKAYIERRYIPDEMDRKDRNGNYLGSIIGYEQSQKIHDITYIRSILTITSYSKKFVAGDSESDIENTEHNILELVVSDFLKRINEELCWLYLQQLSIQ